MVTVTKEQDAIPYSETATKRGKIARIGPSLNEPLRQRVMMRLDDETLHRLRLQSCLDRCHIYNLIEEACVRLLAEAESSEMVSFCKGMPPVSKMRQACTLLPPDLVVRLQALADLLGVDRVFLIRLAIFKHLEALTQKTQEAAA